jgi:serine/threonine protein kinase/Tol biopolymer transport system component
MTLAGGTRLGPYEIIEPLGAGGMGEVYRAHDPRLGREVAIKVVAAAFSSDPERLRRFEQEARAAAALNHPNICTIYDVGHADGTAYIAMELLAGETLEHRLARGALPVGEWLDLAIALSDAVSAAHASGTLHRDLKPANIFVTARGPKVLDFGLAKPAKVADSRDTTQPPEAALTGAGTTVGTVAYMSPEQLRGELVDARSDLFSLGLVLYEAITGRPAFTGATSAVISAAILHGDPAPPLQLRPDLPARFDDVLLKALEKDRAVRYQTAADLLADLRRARRDLPSRPSDHALPVASAATPDALPADSRGAASSDAHLVADLIKRHRVGVALTAAVAILAAVAAAYALWGGRTSPGPPGFDQVRITRLTTSGNASRPAMSPDGRYVAYVQQDGVDTSLWIRQTATASNVQIVPPTPGETIIGVTVTPDGNFVDFIRGGARRALFRVPFLGGTAARIAEEVDGPEGWSSDGRQMAFMRSELATGTASLVVADADGGHERVVTIRKPPERFILWAQAHRPSIRPAWSPDGRTIALFGSNQDSSQVVFVDVSSGAQRPIDGAFGAPEGLAWLDAESLVVNVKEAPDAPTQLWRYASRDGAMSRVTNDLNDYAGVSLSHDARALVTSRFEERMATWIINGAGEASEAVPDMPMAARYSLTWAGDRLVYSRIVDGRSVVVIGLPGQAGSEETIVIGESPAASADGQEIVFVKPAGDERGLWRKALRGGSPVRLTTGHAQWPVVTPDGRHVLFVHTSGEGQFIWSVSIDGGEPRVLSKEFAFSPDVSRDGRTLLYASNTGAANDRIFVLCDLPGCTSRRTLPRPRAGGAFRLTPDGKAIAQLDEPGINVWIRPLDGSAPRQLTRFTDRTIVAMAWSADGERLAVTRTATTNDIVLFSGLKGGTP